MIRSGRNVGVVPRHISQPRGWAARFAILLVARHSCMDNPALNVDPMHPSRMLHRDSDELVHPEKLIKGVRHPYSPRLFAVGNVLLFEFLDMVSKVALLLHGIFSPITKFCQQTRPVWHDGTLTYAERRSLLMTTRNLLTPYSLKSCCVTTHNDSRSDSVSRLIWLFGSSFVVPFHIAHIRLIEITPAER
jgi:hypothetical protein